MLHERTTLAVQGRKSRNSVLAIRTQIPNNRLLFPPLLSCPSVSGYMEKIVISAAEVARTEFSPDVPTRLEPKLQPAVPGWAKWSLSPLVLVLPLLCLVAIVLRLAMRSLPPRNRYAWTSFLSTLLIVSGIATSAATVLAFSFAPLPSIVGAGLGELDEQTNFPSLPSASAMSAREVSEKLEPRSRSSSGNRAPEFTRDDMPSASFRGGHAVTGHTRRVPVCDGAPCDRWTAMECGARGFTRPGHYDLGRLGRRRGVGRHRNLDLLLLWVARESGTGSSCSHWRALWSKGPTFL